MSHKASFYTIQVRKKGERQGYQLLGDFDGEGTRLIDVLNTILNLPLSCQSFDGSKSVRCEECIVAGTDLRAKLVHGESGLEADIASPDGTIEFHQTPPQVQLIRCMSLFRLPLAQDMGWLAVHNNNGRGIKGLMSNEIQANFRTAYEGSVLEVKPYVEAAVFLAAVEQRGIDKVKLVRHERPNDWAAADTRKWVPAGGGGRLQLDISTSRSVRLLPNLIRRFLQGDYSVRNQIFTFEDLAFDEANIEVTLDNGSTRTFNIERADTGHAVTEVMQDLVMVEDVPTDESVLDSLGRSIQRVSN